MPNEDTLLEIARFIGIAGLSIFVLSGVGGALMASRTVQQINVKWLRGKMFKYHRLASLTGFGLILLHPIPMFFARETTGGLNLFQALVPFTATKQTFAIGVGTIALYFLIVVAISSIFIKYLNRALWRGLHYATYAVIFIGLLHGLLVSGEFREDELFEIEEPEKIILLILSIIALSLPAWRLFFAKRFLEKETNLQA